MEIQNTEDKLAYCKLGLVYELAFVEKVAPYIGLQAEINPEKTKNPYAHDLIAEGRKADLKYQGQPFFRAGVLYGVEPTFAVTFNAKDYRRYKKLYPDLVVYFWLERSKHDTELDIGSKTYRVQPVHGVWRAEFSNMSNLIEKGDVPLHEYTRRKSDTAGNAKDSYVFDIRQFECLAAYTRLRKRKQAQTILAAA